MTAAQLHGTYCDRMAHGAPSFCDGSLLNIEFTVCALQRITCDVYRACTECNPQQKLMLHHIAMRTVLRVTTAPHSGLRTGERIPAAS